MGFALAMQAQAAPITVTITGVTGEIHVGEGPIFGHSSYQSIAAGAPFVLTYTFDETKGKQSISKIDGAVITESKIEATGASSPGINAVLQIGSAVWEFGQSTVSQVALQTASGGKGEQFVFRQAGNNRISVQIAPSKGAYWPTNGDWRAGFLATSLDGSNATFSADNDRVSAKGDLVPETITVTGVDIDGQWLRAVAPQAGGPAANGERRWQLAHTSPRGGYIVEEVTRTILGTNSDGSPITPSLVRYWQAWRVTAGTNVGADGVDNFPSPGPAGSSGEEKVTATARFYEAVELPASFAPGKSPYAGGRLSSTTDPGLPTSNATLPVSEAFTLHFQPAAQVSKER